MKTRKKLRASNLHSDVLDGFGYEESDVSLLNHQTFGDLLIDPEENKSFKAMRDTHSVFASRKTKAGLDDLEDDPLDSLDDLVSDMPLDGLDAIESELDDEENPDEIDADELEDLEDLDPDSASPLDVLSALDEGGDPETELEKSKDKANDNNPEQRPDEVKAKKVKAEEVELQNNQTNGPIEVDSNVDYSLVDVDCIADDIDCNELVFASFNGAKHVIHSNRIIASLTAEAAEVNEVSDVYLDDDFDEAVMSEVECKGLRAGLRSMGFTLASVKIKASKQVSAGVAKATADFKAKAIEAEAKQKEIMTVSYALAAVGLNRNMFKDHQNTLRSELTARLEAAGVRHASRMVKAAFNEFGVAYANTLMTVASDIAKLPEETRAGLMAQLDMTNEPDEELMADPNLYGDPVTGEDQDEEDVAVDSIEAALRNPIKASKVQVSASNKKLPFAIY